MQVRVTGAQYGKWGREKYGVKPQKLDALEFYPDRLQELWRNIQEEQVGCCDSLVACAVSACHMLQSCPSPVGVYRVQRPALSVEVCQPLLLISGTRLMHLLYMVYICTVHLQPVNCWQARHEVHDKPLGLSTCGVHSLCIAVTKVVISMGCFCCRVQPRARRCPQPL